MRTTFRETMAGVVDGRPFTLRLAVDQPGAFNPFAERTATLSGTVDAPGLADGAPVTGTLRIAPVAARTIAYDVAFTAADGRRLRLAGAKTIAFTHPVRSMTILPVTLTSSAAERLGTGTLRFALRDLPSFLGGFRIGTGTGPADVHTSRWRGQPGRLEVWYSTFTDPATGTGVWIHHELVAPAGGGPAQALGWAAVFPPGERPLHGRFGPQDAPALRDAQVFAATDVALEPGLLRGVAGDVSWELRERGGGAPLHTFPAWSWRREWLPAAHLVTAPGATFDGSIRYAGRELRVEQAVGASARIYGHGNAQRWAWLHADLGGGDVLEIVTAVSRRPGLRALRPLTFLRLRVGGREWPARDQLLAALRYTAHIDLPAWWVSGRFGDRRIRVRVHQDAQATLALDYADPDGAPAVCRNSERADALVVLERRTGRTWVTEREWHLDGTAHAEVGTRD
ncbi:hypothetical protein [Pseudonocardia sp. GCM10023141]|uniref:hypothetical protein n=1 Tax=Pseudonocardia sp. GCM10023141 TaxID=3252653 RepID=UPI00360604B0